LPWGQKILGAVIRRRYLQNRGKRRRLLLCYGCQNKACSNGAAQISQARESGDQDLGDTYYHYWLAALEKLLLEKSVLDSKAVRSRVEQWRRAYLNTPHGQPIELSAGREPADI